MPVNRCQWRRCIMLHRAFCRSTITSYELRPPAAKRTFVLDANGFLHFSVTKLTENNPVCGREQSFNEYLLYLQRRSLFARS